MTWNYFEYFPSKNYLGNIFLEPNHFQGQERWQWWYWFYLLDGLCEGWDIHWMPPHWPSKIIILSCSESSPPLHESSAFMGFTFHIAGGGMQALEGPGTSGGCRNSEIFVLILSQWSAIEYRVNCWRVWGKRCNPISCLIDTNSRGCACPTFWQLKPLRHFKNIFIWFQELWVGIYSPNYEMAQILAAVYEVEHSIWGWNPKILDGKFRLPRLRTTAWKKYSVDPNKNFCSTR